MFSQQFKPALDGLARGGIFVGTSSWKYSGWSGQIYDEQRYLTQSKFSEAKFERECLAEYARTFSKTQSPLTRIGIVLTSDQLFHPYPKQPHYTMKQPVIFCLCTLTALLIATASSFATGALLTNDTTVFTGSNASQQGPAVSLTVSNTSTKSALVKFDVSSMLPAGTTANQISTVSLRLFVNTAPTGTGSVTVHRITGAWTEATAAGAGPTFNATPSATIPVSSFALNQFIALDVTDVVKTWITTPASNLGLAFRPSGTITVLFDSKEATAQAHEPQLDITLRESTLLNGTVNPTATTGQDGDSYLNTATAVLFGPKAAGAWPSGVSLLGPAGPQGAAGATGARGNSVLNGTAAPTAAIGIDGDFYLNKTTNALFGPKAAGAWPPTGQSLIGPQGAAGVQGLAGSQGIQGIQGLAGARGNSVLSGTAAPTAAIGSDGDFYINTATNVLFGPKAAGAWPATGQSLIGPQGMAGVQGLTGSQGIQGVQGSAGARGSSVLHGAGSPGSAFGMDGDFYLDTAANVLFGPKVTGAWPAPGQALVGSQGQQGLQGPAGPATLRILPRGSLLMGIYSNGPQP